MMRASLKQSGKKSEHSKKIRFYCTEKEQKKQGFFQIKSIFFICARYGRFFSECLKQCKKRLPPNETAFFAATGKACVFMIILPE